MTDVIEHRGPDEAGHLLEPGVALGMRRLSIIDVGGSHQPIANEDGDVSAVFNGEIFNFVEIRAELEAAGLPRLDVRPFFIPQTVRLPAPLLRALIAAERIGPLARALLRARFTYVCSASR
jgi:hypothetical protein